MRGGMMEEVSEVSVNDVPGDEYQKARAWQILGTTYTSMSLAR